MSAAELSNTLEELFVGLVVEAVPMPPDPKVHGFTNDAASMTVGQLHMVRLESIASAYAQAATRPSYMSTLLPCEVWSSSDEQRACAKAFVRSFATRAFRGPVHDDWLARLDSQVSLWLVAIDFPAAIELSIVTILLSPQFLYRLELNIDTPEVEVAVSPHELATRLSYALWGSMPDDTLLEAANDGTLLDDETLSVQVRRMQSDPRATVMWSKFHTAWLGMDRLLSDEHNRRVDYPQWNGGVQDDAFDALQRFFAHLYHNAPTLGALLEDRTAFLTGRLAPYHGIAMAPDASWT